MLDIQKVIYFPQKLDCDYYPEKLDANKLYFILLSSVNLTLLACLILSDRNLSIALKFWQWKQTL